MARISLSRGSVLSREYFPSSLLFYRLYKCTDLLLIITITIFLTLDRYVFEGV